MGGWRKKVNSREKGVWVESLDSDHNKSERGEKHAVPCNRQERMALEATKEKKR